MFKKNVKFLAALISASMITCSVPIPALASEIEENVYTEEGVVLLTTSSSAEGDRASIIISDTGISSESSSVTVKESDGVKTVTISENGIYSLSGEGSSVVVSVDKKLKVTLEISDVTVDNSGIPADEDGIPENSFIESGAGSTVNIVLNGSLTVKGGKNAVDAGKKSVINISGEGSMSSEGAADGAISSKYGEINIYSGTVDISENGDDAVKAKGGAINILGGTLNITGSEGDGLKAKYDSKSEYTGTNGLVKISGGTVNITKCGGDGIQAENVEISGGNISIDTWYAGAATGYYSSSAYSEGSSTDVNYLWESGESVKYERVNIDTGSHKGIKAGTKAKTLVFADDTDKNTEQEASGSLKISGGNITIDTTKSGLKANSVSTSGYNQTRSGKYIIGSPDDAISCNEDIEITGGKIVISSSDDGISTMKELSVTGDTVITVNTSYEGIEAKSVIIGKEDGSDDPEVSITSADDGINTSGKTLTYTYDTYDGYEDNDEINYIKKSVSSSDGNNMTVNSGRVNILIDSEGTKSTSLPDGSLTSLKAVSFKSAGDGIDCNGSLTQNGGEIYVYGQSSGDNSPIDTNSGYTFNAGSKVLGTGVDGMNEASPKSGTGSYLTYGSSGGFGFPGGNDDGGNTPPEMPGGNGNDGNTPPEMPGGNGNDGNTPPEMPGGNGNDGNTPPEMPGGNDDGGNTPPEMPGGNDDGGNTSPEMPGGNGNGGNTPLEMPGGNSGTSFSAGQYWAVLDADSEVVDYGELKYSGSFIVYGSDLISDGNYTLTVTDSKPSLGDVVENKDITDDTKTPDDGDSKENSEGSVSENGTVSGNASGAGTVSSNIISGSFKIGDIAYEYRYTGKLAYNGRKQKLSDLTINNGKVGSTLSGNVIFKSVKYRNNKAVGEGRAIPVLKAAKGADSATKKAVRAINKQFKSQYLSFTIEKGSLDAEHISGKAVYNSNTGKWKFSLKQTNADGTTSKLRYRSNGKGDFTVDTASLDENAGTVKINGVNNYTGTAQIPVTIN